MATAADVMVEQEAAEGATVRIPVAVTMVIPAERTPAAATMATAAEPIREDVMVEREAVEDATVRIPVAVTTVIPAERTPAAATTATREEPIREDVMVEQEAVEDAMERTPAVAITAMTDPEGAPAAAVATEAAATVRVEHADIPEAPRESVMCSWRNSSTVERLQRMAISRRGNGR
jgi:hypothetical protein